MRFPSTNSLAATLVAWLLPLAGSITVPSGKLTPITPAKPTPRYINPHAPSNPASVVEYTQDNPEPPPLDPSYVPVHYDFFNTLSKHHVYYVPMRFRNFNSISNEVGYEPPQKYYPGQTLGKNVGYKPFKQQVFWRQPVWTNNNNVQYNNQQQGSQYTRQADSAQYNNQQQESQNNNNVQYNNQQQESQYTRQADSAQYNNQQQEVQINNQYNAQPTPEQQQQLQENLSTQPAPASTLVPQAHTDYAPRPRKVDYSTGKGSYDVTGKGGSKSEYYSLGQDWSKKSAYPKKVLGQELTHKKYPSHKY